MAIGPWQIAVVVLLVVLLFGATRIAGIGKGLGEGIRNFKKALSDEDSGRKKLESSKDDGDKKDT